MDYTKKYKSLILKYHATSIEREIHEEAYVIARIEFKQEFEKLLKDLGPEAISMVEKKESRLRSAPPRQNMPPPPPPSLESPSSSPDSQKNKRTQKKPTTINTPLKAPTKEKSPEGEDKYKKLFRKLANLLHPDKLISETSAARDRKSEQFKELQSAMNEDKKGPMLIIALELGILPDKIEDSDLQLVQNLVDQEEGKILYMVETFAWKWYNSKTEKEKESWMYKFFQNVTDK